MNRVATVVDFFLLHCVMLHQGHTVNWTRHAHAHLTWSHTDTSLYLQLWSIDVSALVTQKQQLFNIRTTELHHFSPRFQPLCELFLLWTHVLSFLWFSFSSATLNLSFICLDFVIIFMEFIFYIIQLLFPTAWDKSKMYWKPVWLQLHLG